MPEIEKVLAELKRLMEFRKNEGGMQEDDFLGFGLTSRKNLCIHPSVSKEKKGKAVDARCRDITNAAVCEKNRADPGSVEVCDWHEVRRVLVLKVFLPLQELRFCVFSA